MKQFKLICPVRCFPSDNTLDSLPLKERIAIKKFIREAAFTLTLEWMKSNNVKRWNLTPHKPFFVGRAELNLIVTYNDNRRRDIHNLSIKHFLDQVVAMNIIKDDSIEFIPRVVFSCGGKAELSYAEFSLTEII